MTHSKPRIFADFQNADRLGRIRLNCLGTVQDLNAQGIQLKDGQEVLLQQEQLEVEGTVLYSEEEKIWVAVVDWSAIKGAHAGFEP